MNGMKGLLLCAALFSVVVFSFAQFIDIEATLTPVIDSYAAWGDYDNDNDLDVLLIGQADSSTRVAKVYRNDGNEVFTDINANLFGLSEVSAEWGDINNDGYLDILMAGYYYYSYNGYYAIKIYLNGGDGTFSELTHSLPTYQSIHTDWADYDNDGDLDVLVTGYTGVFYAITKIFQNDGNCNFTEITTNLIGVGSASSDWGDCDNDGDLDLVLTGFEYWYNDQFHRKSTVYLNNGDGTFSGNDLPGVQNGCSKFGDYDNDGYLDLILLGRNTNNGGICKIYHNNGNGYFTDVNVDFGNIYDGYAEWGDYDNDGDMDVVISGAYPDVTSKTRICRYDGNNVFTVIDLGLIGSSRGCFDWGDFNNDGMLDLLMSGDYYYDGWNHSYLAKIYRNVGLVQNTQPYAPTDLFTNIDSEFVHFNWQAALDNETPISGLTYNLRVGTTPGGNDILSSNSGNDGTRRVSEPGLVNSNCSWKIQRSALPDSFYWSVQAIDSAFQGSAFAEQQSVSFVPRVSLRSNAYLNFGEIPIGGWSDWKQVIIENTSLADVNISNIHLHYDPSQYEINYPYSVLALLPGAIDTLFVRFAPSLLGSQNDTLYVVSDAVNSPLIKIRLAGESIQVPPLEPDNLEVQMDGNSVVLSWSPVTQTVFDTPIEPDYYFVYQSNDPYGQYFLLGVTPNLTYTHALVGIGAQRMFYKITAYKYYGRGSFDISSLGLELGMPEDEIMRRLKE